jgi:hypothetical protein
VNKLLMVVGVLLIIVAIILGAVQHYSVGGYNFYGDASNKWYFYGLVGVVGLIGILVAVWSYMKKSAA